MYIQRIAYFRVMTSSSEDTKSRLLEDSTMVDIVSHLYGTGERCSGLPRSSCLPDWGHAKNQSPPGNLGGSKKIQIYQI